ncbi:hypothetical protein ABT063_02155 [Streptomyces sp. NPDC002838]|uniref:hypothetical protein n=1 Tax=Streptomyces sp. NPDC002838 TaxID=3154436 RepID=UPI003327A395
MTDLSTSACAGNTTLPVTEPSDLDVAIRVAQQLLGSDSVPALREALRLLLRALDAEPVTEDEKARRFVDRHFPEVAAFLANERGEGQ